MPIVALCCSIKFALHLESVLSWVTLMPEPVSTIGGLGLGVVASYLANRVDDAQKPLFKRIASRLERGGSNLPPNHDLEHSCRKSLVQAIEFMVQSMDLQVDEPTNLVEAIKNTYDSEGKWQPILARWKKPEGNWIRALLKAARSEAINSFDLMLVCDASSLNKSIRYPHDKRLQDAFHKAMIAWAGGNVGQGKEPSFFRAWINDGWPIQQGKPDPRTTLYQIWCLFFHDEMKKNKALFRILTADWLSNIDAEISQLAIDGYELEEWLAGQLGEQIDVLENLQSATKEIQVGLNGLESNLGQLMSVVGQFRVNAELLLKLLCREMLNLRDASGKIELTLRISWSTKSRSSKNSIKYSLTSMTKVTRAIPRRVSVT